MQGSPRPLRSLYGTRRRAAVALAFAVVSGLSGVLVVAPPALAAPAGGAASGASAIAATAALPFAERAGYSAKPLAAATDEHPARGNLTVEVVFSSPLAPAAYAAARSYFRSEGLVVSAPDPDRITLGLSGPASTTASAFGTELDTGTLNGSAVRLAATPPSLPSWLESEVAGVEGLSNGLTTFSFGLVGRAPSLVSSGASAPAIGAQTMTPGLAREFYGLSALYNLTGGPKNAANLSLAVILWGNGYRPNDLSSFFSQDYPSSFPVGTITPHPIGDAPMPSNSATEGPDDRAVEELTLDIEWSESMAPGATIYPIYAPNGPSPGYSPSTANLTAALSTAIALNVSAISMSFGTPESTDGSLSAAWGSLFAEAARKNITVLAATGDTGGDSSNSPECSGTPSPEYPASSPQVIAVGGTNVTIDRIPGEPPSFSEAGWSGSGGGFSNQFAAPSWQEVGSAAGPVKANGHRGMPDVSATAAQNFLFYNGTDAVAGGTSFATPLWAGLLTMIDAKWGHRLGFVTPRLYHVGASEAAGAIGKGIVDVTSGANCVATAGPGWDEVTGWGSPRAAVLYDDLLGSFVSLALHVAHATVAPGGSLSVGVEVSNRTSGAALSGVEVTLSARSDTDLGPCTGTFASSSPVTNATGWASATVSVPFCYLGQHALVNASVNTTKLYGMSGTRIGVNLLGFDPALQALGRPPWAYVTFVAIVGSASVAGAWLGRPREPSSKRGRLAPPKSPPTPSAAPGPGVPAAPNPPTIPSSPASPNPPAPPPAATALAAPFPKPATAGPSTAHFGPSAAPPPSSPAPPSFAPSPVAPLPRPAAAGAETPLWGPTSSAPPVPPPGPSTSRPAPSFPKPASVSSSTSPPATGGSSSSTPFPKPASMRGTRGRRSPASPPPRVAAAAAPVALAGPAVPPRKKPPTASPTQDAPVAPEGAEAPGDDEATPPNP